MRHNRLLTEAETAEWLGIRARTLRWWRSSNTGPPYVKLGRLVRYSPEDLRRWVSANTVAPGSCGDALFASV